MRFKRSGGAAAIGALAAALVFGAGCRSDDAYVEEPGTGGAAQEGYVGDGLERYGDDDALFPGADGETSDERVTPPEPGVGGSGEPLPPPPGEDGTDPGLFGVGTEPELEPDAEGPGTGGAGDEGVVPDGRLPPVGDPMDDAPIGQDDARDLGPDQGILAPDYGPAPGGEGIGEF